MDMLYLSSMIRFHRKKANLTQEALAKLAGVGKTVIFDVEKGKTTIRLDSIVKILDTLNIKIVFQSPLITLFEENFYEKS